MRKRAIVILVAIPFALAGCGGVAKQYLEADKATFDAVAPEYRKYVNADPALSAEQKERRGRTIDTWKMRIEKGSAE